MHMTIKLLQHSLEVEHVSLPTTRINKRLFSLLFLPTLSTQLTYFPAENLSCKGRDYTYLDSLT